MKRAKPTIWLAFGLVALTVMLIVLSHSIGILPDGAAAEREGRAKVAEALAVQLAAGVGRNDLASVEETLSAVVERNPDVLSAAVRGADGTLYAFSGAHEGHWVPSPDGRSTPTHVSVPLIGADGPQGQIEIAFAPGSLGAVHFGIPRSVLLFVAFIAAAGFGGYYLLLRRSLTQLDPGRVVPERVQRAFDTVSEGIVILDERERILLANASFVETLGETPKIGTSINRLAWRTPDGASASKGARSQGARSKVTRSRGGYAWQAAIRGGARAGKIRDEALGLRTGDGVMHNLSASAAAITGDDEKVIGAIVTLSDVTRLKRSQDDLAETAARLAEREAQLSRQSEELEYLATHDALSGCLNRRTFLSVLERRLGASTDPMSLVVVEIEGFSDLVDAYGPAVTDRLVTATGALLRELLPDTGIVSRPRGEEFVLALEGVEIDAQAFAAGLEAVVAERAGDLLPGHEGLGVRTGVAASRPGEDTAHRLIRRADAALGARDRAPASELAPAQGTNPAHGAEPVERRPLRALSSGAPDLWAGAPDGAALRLRAFDTSLERLLAQAGRSERRFALMHLRLTSWDYLREALGETIAARLVEEAAATLREALRSDGDLLVLPDAGEIVMAVSDLETVEDVEFAVARQLDRLRRPFALAGRDIYVAAKIGVSMFPADGRDPATLKRHARIAMRRALDDHSLEGTRFYSAEMTQASEWRMNVESGIREALANDQFELFFQPVVCARTGALAAAEALLRCTNERLADVGIGRIIGIAERSALSEEIDEWVLRRGLQQMHEWCDTGLSLPKVSLNVSARQLSNVAFMDRLFEMIRQVRFSPTRVQIEVTESARMSDIDTAAPQLKRLQELGVQIALDDFGTGQASLTYLQRLHPDTLKIDRSFIDDITVNHANATLVAAATVMAQSMGVQVVVEGVEQEEQLQFLRETGCDEVQGYLVARPMPTDAMTAWLLAFVADNGTKDFIPDLEAAPLAAGEVRPGAIAA